MKFADVAENVTKLVESPQDAGGTNSVPQASSLLLENSRDDKQARRSLYAEIDKFYNGLRAAYHNLAVDQPLPLSKPFTSDEERLKHLFKLYEEMVAKESKGII